MTLIPFSSIVEKNGKTIRENNLEISHNIALGSLVEVKYDAWFGDGACEIVHARLWIVMHSRDCDGTPLYVLSKTPYEDFSRMSRGERTMYCNIKGGFSEEALTVVPITDELKKGYGALEWEKDE